MIRIKYSQQIQNIHSHFHDGYQLLYVTAGKIRITVSDRTYEASPGSLVLIGRLESHAIQVLTPDYCRYTVSISPEIEDYKGLLGEKILSLLSNRPEQFRHCVDMTGCPQVETLLGAMAAEAADTGDLSGRMLLMLLGQLLIHCCRLYPMQVPEDSQRLHIVTKIQRYLESHVAQPVSLQDLSEAFHLSPSYLSHLFKHITGSSVMAYMTAYRLLVAKRYLVETAWPISRIAESSGFTDSSNFGRAFKKTTGLSPSQFRKQFRQ